MTLGFDIASLTLNVVQIGAKIALPFAKVATKDTAQQSYDEAVRQYSRMRKLREDILVNQYLSEDEKSQLDASIERLVFNLMKLEQALGKVKAISYWQIRSYPTELQAFNETKLAFIQRVEDVSKDIYTRSSQARERAMAMENRVAQLGLEATRVAAMSDSNPNSDSDARRDIIDALEVAAASSIRSSVEAVNSNHRLEDYSGNIISRGASVPTSFTVSPIGMNRSTAVNSRNLWRVPAISGSTPSLISHSGNIELEVFGTILGDID